MAKSERFGDMLCIPTLSSEVAIPLQVDLFDREDATRRMIGQRLRAHAMVVLEPTQEIDTREGLERVAKVLNLGAPFMPPLYGKEAELDSISKLRAREEGTGGSSHPSFERTSGQRFHTDGTLQQIDEVKTSILACERPAAEGGESIIFNALAAFVELSQTDACAAEALLKETCLKRQANINGSREAVLGPAFALRDHRLVTRYSVTETDSWQFAGRGSYTEDDGSSRALRRAVQYMDDASRPGSDHVMEFGLDAGQIFVFSNSRICHGRKSYIDDSAFPRVFYRGLYLQDAADPRSW